MLKARRRSVLISKDKPRRVYQDLAVDEFGELATRKRDAAKIARDRGHDMRAWHRRSNDTAGRWNASCVTCNRMAVVCTEAPAGMADSYGPALTQDCSERSSAS